MSRSDANLTSDILDAIAAIRSHVTRGSLDDGLIMDAVAMRLIEIGEAVKSLSADAKASEPDVKWREIGRMRDLLAHHYFGTSPDIIQSTVDKELQPLQAAVERIRLASRNQS